MPTIEKHSTETGFAVKIPFELKDLFKDNFPSTRWNDKTKRWEVGPRSEKRLDSWIAAAEPQAAAIVAAREALEAIPLAEEELDRLDRQISRLRRELEENVAELRALEVVQADIARRRDELSALQAEATAKQQAVNLSAAEVRSHVSRIIDVPAVQAAIKTLAWTATAARKQMNHERHDEAMLTLRAERHKLLAAGFESDEIRRLLGCNYNRPDRDDTRSTLDKALTVRPIS